MKFRPEADIFPLMAEEELRVLAEDIDRQGQLEPIFLYEGDILDGRNRYLAITRYCTSREPRTETVSPESPIAFVIGLNEKRRHLNDSQRAMAAAKALPFFETEAKQRQVRRPLSSPIGEDRRLASDDAASAFGTKARTVQRAKTVQKRGSKKLSAAVDQGQLSLGKAEQIIKLYPDEKDQDKRVEIVRKSQSVSRVKGLTGEFEWYTPRRYLDAAVKVMGDIDLDPASSERAQKHVGARRYYTIEDDGLVQQWSGCVFLNPPYAMPHIKNFTAKIVASYEAGHITGGILLTNNATDTTWWHQAAAACTAVCFTLGRIHFLEASNGDLIEKGSPTHGQTFFYFGPNLPMFSKVFSEFGSVLTLPDLT